MEITHKTFSMIGELAERECDGDENAALERLISVGYFMWRNRPVQWAWLMHDMFNVEFVDDGQPVKKPTSPKWRSALAQALAERDGRSCCTQCGSLDRIDIDHIIPQSRGGTDDLSNLRLLCRRCNSKKGAKMPNETI